MRLTHKVNHGWSPDRTDPGWAAKVEREAQNTTDATERAWRAAQKRLAKAEQRRDHIAAATGVSSQRVAMAEQLVALRLEELRAIERLMTGHAAPARARGKKSWRPVPYADGSAL